MSVQQPASQSDIDDQSQRVASLERLVRRLHNNNRVAFGGLWIVALIVVILFVGILLTLVVQGLPSLINPQFYGTSASFAVGPEIFNTFYILILSEIFLIPISLAAAIYLMEYARQGPLVSSIHFAAETLAGVPSLVLGLFGYAF